MVVFRARLGSREGSKAPGNELSVSEVLAQRTFYVGYKLPSEPQTLAFN